MKDQNLRLYAEFENFRRRTAKERLALMESANEDTLTALLPILDDFERALKNTEETEENTAVLEGSSSFNTSSWKTSREGSERNGKAVGREFDVERNGSDYSNSRS